MSENNRTLRLNRKLDEIDDDLDSEEDEEDEEDEENEENEEDEENSSPSSSSELIEEVGIPIRRMKTKIKITESILEMKRNPLPGDLRFELICTKWEEFIQLLERVPRVSLSETPSPAMPISIDVITTKRFKYFGKTKHTLVFQALAGLIYPTLLRYHESDIYDSEIHAEVTINKKIQFLQDAGYTVINGVLDYVTK